MISEDVIRLGKKSSCPRKEEAMRTLYVTDLDGTLLNTESRINPESLSIINELVEQGMLFTYATARSLESASVVTEGLRLTMPVIVYNGAFIMRPRTQEPSLPGEILYSQFFTREEAGFIRENLEKAGISPLVYSFIRERESVSWNTARENEGIKHYLSNRRWDRRLRPLESAEGLYDGNIFYYTCIGEKEELMPLYEVFSRDRRLRCTIQQELYRPEYWCEVMPGKATKAQAIRTLKDMYGCDRVVSFGDAINDIPMFELSDECYAVENAVPELKSAATGIVGSNDGDGVAKWLRENVK
jgi:Cof subfamily protein (haloacid dehalogenase superfamily)